jgi:hypothetical protein
VINEYLERFRELTGGPEQFWPARLGLDAELRIASEDEFQAGLVRDMEAIRARSALVLEYAWAVPNERALDVLAELAPIVEVGAGGGYWAMLLRERGVDVVAYDKRPGARSASEDESLPPRRVWSEVLEADELVAAKHPDRTLFLCWPPYASDMADKALRAYLKAGGRTLVYVGEDYGGCNASDAFFNLLGKRMKEAETVAIPRYPGMHDYLTVYRRKGRRR